MEVEKKKNNILTQYQYEQIKKLNMEALNLVQEFIDLLDELFKETYRENGFIMNITKIYHIKNDMEMQSRNYAETIKIVIEQGDIRKAENGKINRYYYQDVYRAIKQPVTVQISILKIFTKIIIKKLRHFETKEKFKKIRANIRRRLDKLEKEQNSLFSI